MFIRVRTAVHRVKIASIRDNTALRPADNGGVTRFYGVLSSWYHGRWRSLHGETALRDANEHGPFQTAITTKKN